MKIQPIKSYEPSFGQPSANPRIKKPVIPDPKPIEMDSFTKTILKNPLLNFTKY